MADAGTFVRNPSTNTFALPTGAGDAPLGASAGGTDAMTNPYSKFNANLASILTQMQAASIPARANAVRIKNALQTEGVGAYGNYNPNASPESNITGINNALAAFAPAVQDVNDQIAGTDKAISDFSTAITANQTAYKPETVNPGQSLMTKDGKVLARTPAYLPPQIRPDNGQLDSFDQANGVWKGDTVSAGGNGPGSNGYGTSSGGTGTHPVSTSNNNPFGIKATAYTLKLFTDNGIATSTGTAAKDGGNFLQFDSPAQATKAARLLLQSPVYAKDTVNQALQAWSNNGYNGSILAGTGIDPNSRMSDLSGMQMDTLQAAMLKAEQGIGNGGVQTNAATPAADPRGNAFSPQYAKRVAQIPSAAQKFVLAGPGGAAYVDGDNADKAGYGTLFANAAPKAGLPILSGEGISIVNNMNNLVENVQKMKELVTQNLGPGTSSTTGPFSSFLSHLENTFKAGLNTLTQDSPAYTNMTTYIGGVTSAAAQIKALAGGAGSGLRITGFEIGDTKANLPQAGDSWQTAQAKIAALDTKISQWMHTNFPDVSANQPVQPASQSGSAGASGGTDMSSLRAKYGY